MYKKSINYCDAMIDNNNPQKRKTYSYILLCEAALGKIYESSKNNLDVINLPFLKQGYNSLKSVSRTGPDLNKNFITNDGLIIPLGNIINYPIDINYQYNYSITSEPEYIVYNVEQVKIRYIVQVERNSF